MCKGVSTCTEMDTQLAMWSKQSLLPIPTWFEEQFKLVSQAIQAATMGDLVAARTLLQSVKSDDLRNWYVQHALESGRIRTQVLGIPARKRGHPRDTNRRVSPNVALNIFQRDGYRCRYCGIRVFSMDVLRAFRDAVGPNLFCLAKPDADRHGAALAFSPSPDHVDHWNGGGRTDLGNLVTACWPCQFGKNHFSLEQLGLDDPRARPPYNADGWDGLIALLPQLRQRRFDSSVN